MPEPLTDAGAPSNAFMDLTPRLVRTETANSTSCRFPALYLLYLAQLICDAIDFIQTRVPGFPALREGTISGRSGCEGSHPLGWQPGDPYSILILILTCWSVPPPHCLLDLRLWAILVVPANKTTGQPELAHITVQPGHGPFTCSALPGSATGKQTDNACPSSLVLRVGLRSNQ